MRNSLATFFSLVLIGMGLVTIVWVTSSMLAPAQSQPAVLPPGGTLPPPVHYQIPSKEELEAEARNAPPTTQPPPEPPPTVPQPAMPTPLPPTAAPSAPTMDLPPPSMDLPATPGIQPPVDTPALGAPPSQTEAFVAGIQNPEGYTYDPTGRRDPFRPFGQSQVVAPAPPPIPIPTPAEGVPPALQPPAQLSTAEPLQQYDLAQLKVVGIVWEVRNPKAMIKDPLGKLHLIKKEAKIGRNNGFVAAIREGEVIVVEPSYGEGGVQTAVTRTMILIR